MDKEFKLTLDEFYERVMRPMAEKLRISSPPEIDKKGQISQMILDKLMEEFPPLIVWKFDGIDPQKTNINVHFAGEEFHIMIKKVA